MAFRESDKKCYRCMARHAIGRQSFQGQCEGNSANDELFPSDTARRLAAFNSADVAPFARATTIVFLPLIVVRYNHPRRIMFLSTISPIEVTYEPMFPGGAITGSPTARNEFAHRDESCIFKKSFGGFCEAAIFTQSLLETDPWANNFCPSSPEACSPWDPTIELPRHFLATH